MRTEDLPIIECPADPRGRGQAHGEALRVVIARKIERWREAIGLAYQRPADRFLQDFLAATDFRPAIAARTPDLLDEISGIAQGAGITQEIAYGLQLMDEEWWFGKAPGDGHCSSLAIAPASGRPTFVGQTMDLPRWHDGAQAVLKIKEHGHDTLVVTSAGMIGLMGVSGRGLGICVNTLSQLGVNRSGLPVAFAMRGALACATAREAGDFLGRIAHASGQNYQIGDRQTALTLECSAAGAVPVDFDGGRSLHTNHPLKSRDAVSPGIDMSGSENSQARLRSLRTDLDARVPADGETIRLALSACRADGAVSMAGDPALPPTEMMTVAGVVYEIGDIVTLSVCAGPPSIESWRVITLR